MTTTAFIVTFAVGPRLKPSREGGSKKRDMTAEELASFTGKRGCPRTLLQGEDLRRYAQPDVESGSHLGKHQAGFDLTDFLNSLHTGRPGLSTPRRRETPGPGRAGREAPHLKAFYFMTFLNLFLVLAVLLIIASGGGVNPIRIALPGN